MRNVNKEWKWKEKGGERGINGGRYFGQNKKTEKEKEKLTVELFYIKISN